MGLIACQAPTEASSLQSYTFGWELFNHRLSELGVRTLNDPAVEVALVGGTSTTAIVFEDPDCVSDVPCGELPVEDRSDVGVTWNTLESRTVVLANATLEASVSAQGSEQILSISLPRRASGTAVALISGFTLDTSRPLPDHARARSCYDPRHGWNPTEISVSLGEPSLAPTRREVLVPVHFGFSAGRTLEEMRTCLDDIVEDAVVGMQVQVTALVGEVESDVHEIHNQASYELGSSSFNPDPQPDPDPAEVQVALSGAPLVGWTSLSWRFHVEDPEARGAYLRTLQATLEPSDGIAFGHATNYSPITQTSGFDYIFHGQVAEVHGEVAVERHQVSVEGLPTTINGHGEAQYHRLAP
ncbi:MAG: hypothetical protein EA397_01620 [Deltaproteobacteria bacterium]|nr:MAG: hypothetical protein EA397_01620 [Deltaproteobacteria bacterium]